MGEGRDQRTAGGLARRFALHTSLLLAAMAAPFFLLDIATASLASAGIAAMYVLWWIVGLILRDRGKSKQPAKVNLLLTVYGISVPIAVGGLMFALIVEWVLWAYLPITSPARVWNVGMGVLTLIAAMWIFPPILFLVFAPLLARKDGGAASRFLKGVRAQGFGWFHDRWLRYTAFNAGLFCLLSIVLASAVISKLELLRDGDDIETNWELMAAYPFLPFALFAAAVILTLSGILATSREEHDAVVRAYIDGAPDGPRPNTKAKSLLRALAAGACVAALFFNIYPIHLGITASGATYYGAKAISGTYEAMENLVNTREPGDWTSAEYVAELNRIGHWAPDAPGAGLATLVEDPGQVFAETCTVRIAAGIIDPTSREAAGGPSGGEAESDVKICIAVACAPPFTWSTPPALWLVTSHATRAKYWYEHGYVDIFADGGLAETFQG